MTQDPSASGQLIPSVTQCTQFLFLNSTVDPFDDIRVREAVNVAIDRANLTRLMGGGAAGDVATSILPPGLDGHLPPGRLNPFATKGMRGDVERGRELLSEAGYQDGYDDEVLLVGASDPPFDRVTESVRSDLERLGFTNIDVKLPAFPNNYTQFYSVPSRNVGVGTSAGWCKAYQDAFTFFDPLFHGDSILEAANQNVGELDDPVLNAAIDRAAGLRLGASRDAAWEEVNEMATRSAVWVPWMWPRANIVHSDALVKPVYLSLISHLDWVNVGVNRRT
jgi:peptide/nickel transport system substrate-binding protein